MNTFKTSRRKIVKFVLFLNINNVIIIKILITYLGITRLKAVTKNKTCQIVFICIYIPKVIFKYNRYFSRYLRITIHTLHTYVDYIKVFI